MLFNEGEASAAQLRLIVRYSSLHGFASTINFQIGGNERSAALGQPIEVVLYCRCEYVHYCSLRQFAAICVNVLQQRQKNCRSDIGKNQRRIGQITIDSLLATLLR